MTGSLKSATKSTSILNKEIGNFKSVAKGVAAGAAAIAGVTVAIAAMAAKGEDLRTMEQGFASLAARIGENAGEMLASMKEASFGLISDFNLIKAANKALILGLPAGAEAMGELAQAAVRLGLATGTDAAQALDQLTSGIATQRKMTLQQLGITIDATVANEKLAESLGVSADSLTAAQKKTAFYNETLEQARMRIEELGDFSVGFGGQIDQLKISIANFSRDSAKFISAFGDTLLQVFSEATGLSNQFGQSLKFNAETAASFAKTTLTFLIDGFVLLAGTIINLLDVFNILQVVLGTLGAGFIGIGENIAAAIIEPMQLAIAGAAKLAEVLGKEGLAQSLNDVSDSMQGVQDSLAGAREATSEWAAQGLTDITANREALDSISDSAARLRAGIEAIPATKVAEATTALTAAVTPSKKLKDNLKDAAAEMKPLADDAKKALGFLEKIAKVADLGRKAFEDSKNDLKAFPEGLQPAVDAINEMSKGAGKLKDDFKNAADELKDIEPPMIFDPKAIKRFKEGLVGAIAGGDAVAAVDSLGDLLEGVQVFGIDIGAVLNAATQLNKELPRMLFQSIKGLLINVVAELPLLVGNIIPDLVIPLLELVPVIFQKFFENIPTMIDGIIRAIPALIKAIILMQPNIIKAIPAILSSILSTWFPNWWAQQKPVLEMSMAELGLKLIDSVQAAFPAAMESIGAEINAWWQRTIWADLTTGFGEVIGAWAVAFDEQITQPFVNAITDAATIFVDTMRTAGENLAAPIVDFLSKFRWPEIKVPSPGGTGGGLLEQVTGFSFQQGTPFVPRTGLAMVHQGEAIIPAAQNAAGFGEINMPMTFNITVAGAGAADEIVRIFRQNTRGAADEVRRIIERRG
jgi:hypothetical protein